MLNARLFAVLLTAVFSTARGEPLLLENFDVSGPLAGSQPAVGNAWVTASGGGETLDKVAGSLHISPTVSQEVETSFASVSAGSVYAGFNLRVTSAPTKPWILPLTFRGENISGGNMVGRIFVTTGTTAGTCRVGIDNNMDQPVWRATELSAGTSYRMVLGFRENGAADVTMLWVNPGKETDASISEIAEDITGEIFGLKLNAYSGVNGALAIDNLIVSRDFTEAAAVSKPSSTPTPASNAAQIAKCRKQLKELQAKLKKAKRKGSKAVVSRLQKKIRQIQQLLEKLVDHPSSSPAPPAG